MKLLLIAGHGEGDSGAVGLGYQEADLTRELVGLLSVQFDGGNVEVDIYDTTKNCYKQCLKGNIPNFRNYHYVLEVHFNASATPDTAGDGSLKGSMFYISQSETGRSVEERILKNLYAIGSRQAWDGVVVAQRQWPNGLYVQEQCRAQGVSHGLLETCFISDKDDMKWYQSNKKAIAKAIADGVIDGFKVREEEKPEEGETGKYYHVQTGAFTEKNNAEKQLKRVKSAGFEDAFIYEDGGFYKVQIGAYEKEENAKNEEKKAKEAGFNTSVELS